MSTSSSSEEETEYFCKDDPRFNDLTPLEQDDGTNPVVQILYSSSFKDNYDYFRAIYQNQEISQRAYFLTEKCINHNPSNYTVWEFRRRLVKELGLSCELELEFTKNKMGGNPKNYQMWHHRNSILDILEDRKIKSKESATRAETEAAPKSNPLTKPSYEGVSQKDITRELALTEFVFSNDAKNYHAWQHRVYLFKKYKQFFNQKNEINYAKKLINQDYRNNSIWNYLFTIHNDDIDKFTKTSHKGYGFKSFDYQWLFKVVFEDNAISEHEPTSTTKEPKLDHSNEASWNFLTAVFLRPETDQAWRQQVYSEVEKLTSQLDPVPFSIVVFLLDTYESMNFSKEKAKNLVRQLKTTDSIRENYWQFVEGCM